MSHFSLNLYVAWCSPRCLPGKIKTTLLLTKRGVFDCMGLEKPRSQLGMHHCDFTKQCDKLHGDQPWEFWLFFILTKVLACVSLVYFSICWMVAWLAVSSRKHFILCRFCFVNVKRWINYWERVCNIFFWDVYLFQVFFLKSHYTLGNPQHPTQSCWNMPMQESAALPPLVQLLQTRQTGVRCKEHNESYQHVAQRHLQLPEGQKKIDDDSHT